MGSTSATPQGIGAFPAPAYSTSAPIPLANNERGAKDISGWPTIGGALGAFGIGAFPTTTSGSATPAPVISITLSNNRAR